MQLAEYLKASGIRRYQFAALAGVSPTTITELCRGSSWPRKELAIKIRELTEGEVTADDFLPPFQPRRRRDRRPRARARQ